MARGDPQELRGVAGGFIAIELIATGTLPLGEALIVWCWTMSATACGPTAAAPIKFALKSGTELACNPFGISTRGLGLGERSDGAGVGVRNAGTGLGACAKIGLCEGPGDTDRSLRVLCKAAVPANNPLSAVMELRLCEGPGDTERSLGFGMALRSAASCDGK